MNTAIFRVFGFSVCFLLFGATVQAASILGEAPSQSPTSAQVAPQMAVQLPELPPSPTLADGCVPQSTIVGSDNAGVITIGPVGNGSWNFPCTINFGQNFQTPACVLSVSGGQQGNGIRIVQIMPSSLIFMSNPYKFQGGERVMYLCEEANTGSAKPLTIRKGIALEASSEPTLGTNCGAQTEIVGSDGAGVITMGPVAENTWNLGCTVTFSQTFNNPACVIAVSGGAADNGIRITQTTPDSLMFISTPNKFQGGEKVMYLCTEASP